VSKVTDYASEGQISISDGGIISFPDKTRSVAQATERFSPGLNRPQRFANNSRLFRFEV
jgi:hypothetical protein